MRTLDDIRRWIEQHHADEPEDPRDTFGPDAFMPVTWISTLLLCVPLAERPTLPGWHLLLPEDLERVVPLEYDAIRAEVADVLECAWWEVPDHHPFTPRTCIHEAAAWLWLLGEDSLADWCMAPASWPMMGVPVLRRVAQHLAIDDRHTGEWEDRMARGAPCEEGCRDCARHGGLGYPVAQAGGEQ